MTIIAKLVAVHADGPPPAGDTHGLALSMNSANNSMTVSLCQIIVRRISLYTFSHERCGRMVGENLHEKLKY
jgi:hypothetical protein